MALRKRTYVIIILAGFILLLSGFGSSYYWLTRIYLPKQLDANINAKNLITWQKEDTFEPPADGKILRIQLHRFIQVNESLSFILRHMHDQFEDQSWRFAYELIEMQPEWSANKYVALKRFGLSPREYDWIFKQVVEFMVQRWKEESISKLKTFGWDFSSKKDEMKDLSVNYDLLLEHQTDLSQLYEIFWPAEHSPPVILADSI
jgi:hypothetical protein